MRKFPASEESAPHERNGHCATMPGCWGRARDRDERAFTRLWALPAWLFNYRGWYSATTSAEDNAGFQARTWSMLPHQKSVLFPPKNPEWECRPWPPRRIPPG